MNLKAHEDAVYLHTEIGSREFAQSKLFPLLKEAGFLVSFNDSEIDFTEWFFTGTQEDAGKKTKTMTLIGPGFEGRSFYEILMEGEREKKQDSIYRIQRAYAEAAKKNIALPNTGPMGILVSEDSLLFLPQELCLRSFNALSETKKSELFGRFKNRSLSGQDSIDFCLAVYIYIYLTGDFPYPSLDEEKRQEHIQYAECIPLHLYNPSFPQDMILAVESILQGKKEKPSLPLLDKSYLEPEITEKNLDILREKERKEWLEKKQKRNSRIIFLKKHATKLIIFAAIFFLLALTIIGFMRDKKAGPNSLGLSDIETIEAYYTAVNTLDLSLSSNLLYKKAKSPYESIIATYHVIKMTRESYERIRPFVHPIEKIQNASLVDSGMFGISHLRIGDMLLNPFSQKASAQNKIAVPDIADNEKRQYTVEFYFIKNEGEDDLVVEFCEDYVELVFHKDRWLITKIEASSNIQMENYVLFLEKLENIAELPVEEKIKLLEKEYVWMPSLEELYLYKMENDHND
jgi:hypothetical protein